MARTYGLHLIVRSLGSLGATLGLIMVVFLAERLTGFVELLIERQGSLVNLPWILTLTAPEIVISAMPIAVLIGVHRALAEAREGGETVVMAGAGVGPWGLVSALVWLGVAAFFFVVVVTGFVEPASRAMRDRLFLDAAHRMAVDSVENGLPRDRVTSLMGYTFVSPATAGDTRRLMVVFPRQSGAERVVTAGHYDLERNAETGRHHLVLKDVMVTDLPLQAPSGSGAGTRTSSASSYRLGALGRDIDLDEVLREPELPDAVQYQSLRSLIAKARQAATKAYGLKAAEIVTRAALAVAAVLLAAIAVSFADGRRRHVTLPAAGAAMVAIDLAVVRVVRAMGDGSALLDLAHAGLATAVLLAVLGFVLKLRYPAVVASAGGRA